MKTLKGIADLHANENCELGVSGWRTVTQQDIDAFAKVTGDYQWIHVDTERAAGSPFGTTIAHGLLTLSLGPGLVEEIYRFEGFSFGLNYGLNRVRFPAPVPVGSRIRMRATLTNVEDLDGGAQATVTQTFERENESKPVCVAEMLVRLIL